MKLLKAPMTLLLKSRGNLVESVFEDVEDRCIWPSCKNNRENIEIFKLMTVMHLGKMYRKQASQQVAAKCWRGKELVVWF